MAAAARGTEATVSLDIFSAYVWRGITLNEGTVMQPSIDVALPGGFGVNVWGNFDIADSGGALNDGEFSELDVTVSYSLSAGSFDLAAGFIQYTFPQQPGPDASDTMEIYVSASRSTACGAAFGLDVYYDIDQVEDFYASASLSYSRAIAGRLTGEVNGSAGYAGGGWTASGNPGAFDYSIALVLTLPVNEILSVGASAAFVGSLDDDTLSDDMVDRTFLCGANISGSF
jgi:hypothetical protein